MPVFYRVHARVLKIFSREDVIPGLVDCIRFASSSLVVFSYEQSFILSLVILLTPRSYSRKSAESGADVARVETDLWTHLRPLIDPFYLCGFVFSLFSFWIRRKPPTVPHPVLYGVWARTRLTTRCTSTSRVGLYTFLHGTTCNALTYWHCVPPAST